MLDVLSDVLNRLRVTGTLYFRTQFTSPWGVEVPAYENVARFHFAHRGDCLVRVAGAAAPVALNQGDLVIIPHGAGHKLHSRSTPLDQVLPLDRVVDAAGYGGEGVLVYGGHDDGWETQLICGHFSFAAGARHLIFERLPAHIHVANYGETAGRWMEATLRMIGEEAGGARLGGDLIALRMTEVILAQAIRTYLETQARETPGLAGFADPQLARALAALHRDPSAAWSVETLARTAGLSRTGFAQRFADRMGVTPMHYVTGWRMQVARQAIAEEGASVADAAALAGYASESAFTRVFKRELGAPPSAFRPQAR